MQCTRPLAPICIAPLSSGPGLPDPLDTHRDSENRRRDNLEALALLVSHILKRSMPSSNHNTL